MAEKWTAGEWAQRMASRRKRVKGTCPECGTRFEGIRTRKYCSPACATRAYRRRHQGELNEKRRERYARQKAKQ